MTALNQTMTQFEQDLVTIDARIKLNRIKILELEAEITSLSQTLLSFNQNTLHGKCFKAFANSSHWYQIIKVVSIHEKDIYCDVLSVSNVTALVKYTYHNMDDAVEITVKEFNARLDAFEANLIRKRKQLDTIDTKIGTSLFHKIFHKFVSKKP